MGQGEFGPVSVNSFLALLLGRAASNVLARSEVHCEES